MMRYFPDEEKSLVYKTVFVPGHKLYIQHRLSLISWCIAAMKSARRL